MSTFFCSGYGSPARINDPSDPRYLKHHLLHTPKLPPDLQFKTNYEANFEKPLKTYYGNKEGVVTSLSRVSVAGRVWFSSFTPKGTTMIPI